MKYMLLFTDSSDYDSAPPDAIQKMYAQVGEWWEKYSHSGVIQSGEQLQPARTATTVTPRTGTVTDGPFMEAKEAIGGYAIVEVPDLDAAIAMAKTWPASDHVEIRPIVEMQGA